VALSFARSLIAGAAFTTAVIGASTADAYVVKKTTHGDLVHWETDTVSYTFTDSNALIPSSDVATKKAMGSWSGTVGAPDLYLTAPTADSPTKPGFDSKNGIFYMKDGYAPAGKALAITVLTYDNATGKILDADVIFNGSYRFAVLGEAQPLENSPPTADLGPSTTDGITHGDTIVGDDSALYDLHHVVAHELGHSLGMNDEMERKEALMYRYTAPNDASLREPGSDDISGLAELYSTKVEGHGNGCGSNVAPKKPTHNTASFAMIAAIGMLAFLLLRAKKDRRARLGFVFATAMITVAFLPSVSGKDGRGVARASEIDPGHARAKVTSTYTTIENGLFKTKYELATVACRASACPKIGHGETWGGTVGNITMEVGGYYAPNEGADVDVSFAKLPNPLAKVTKPLGASPSDIVEHASVRVVTAAAR